MTLLALDTTSNIASVAIRASGETVSEISLQSTDGFSHLIFDTLARCKNEAKLDLSRVDCFAAASGPGSFTGLRIALAVVKGLGESLGKPVAGVSNLRALSSCCKDSSFSKKAVLLDARRGEVYAAVYDQALRPLVPETVGPLDIFLRRLGDLDAYEFIAPPGTALPVPFTEAPSALAAAVALCAEQDGEEGKWLDPAALDANYVRRSDAELFWRED